MDLGSSHSSIPPPFKSPDAQAPTAEDSRPDNSARDAPSKLSASGISTWAKSLKIPQPFVGTQAESPSGNAGKSTFARFTGGLGLRLSPKASQPDDNSDVASPTAQPGFLGTLTKGLVDSSKSAVKAVQVKARHVVSQNKRRYQVAYLHCCSCISFDYINIVWHKVLSHTLTILLIFLMTGIQLHLQLALHLFHFPHLHLFHFYLFF